MRPLGVLCKKTVFPPVWDVAYSTSMNGVLDNTDRTAHFTLGANDYQRAFSYRFLSGQKTMAVDLTDGPTYDSTAMQMLWLNDAGEYGGGFAVLQLDRTSYFERFINRYGEGSTLIGSSGGIGLLGIRLCVDIDAGTWGLVLGDGSFRPGVTGLTPGSPGRFYCQLYRYGGGGPAVGVLTCRYGDYGIYTSA